MRSQDPPTGCLPGAQGESARSAKLPPTESGAQNRGSALKLPPWSRPRTASPRELPKKSQQRVVTVLSTGKPWLQAMMQALMDAFWAPIPPTARPKGGSESGARFRTSVQRVIVMFASPSAPMAPPLPGVAQPFTALSTKRQSEITQRPRQNTPPPDGESDAPTVLEMNVQ